MKRVKSYVIGMLLLVALVATVGLAQAAPGDGERGPREPKGVGGEITAIDEASLTVVNRREEAIQVNVDEETVVVFIETQSEGSVSDLEIGDKVRVRGPRNEDGSVEADHIIVAPEGDRLGGRVLSVEGSTINLENRDGEFTVTTNGDTQFRLGKDETGSLDDVTADKHIMTVGEWQSDTEFAATIVFIKDGPPRGGNRPPRQ